MSDEPKPSRMIALPFARLSGIRRSIALVALITLVPHVRNLYAQGCVMTCPPMEPPVQISLSAACTDILTADLLGVFVTGCPGNLDVTILDNGVPVGNVITAAMIGHTYMAVITHPPSGQSCMTNFTVLDKAPPVVNCPDDVVLPCNTNLGNYTGITLADVADCSDVNITYADELIYTGNCNGDYMAEYRRTYIIADIYNNADTCTQAIYFERKSLTEVSFPPNRTGLTALACSPAPDTSPVATAFPAVGGLPVINGAFCNLAATYTDVIFPLCSGAYKIHRDWTVIDWCANGATVSATQIIEVLDLTPPVVTAPADMTISTGSAGCTASLLLPPATITEDCATSWTVRMTGPFGTMNSNGGMVSGLPVGVHLIHYAARTDCQLEGSDILKVTVADLVPPTTICHATAAISVNDEGITGIPAGALNSGSYDNCGTVYFKVKRMTPPVGYTCANPGNPANLFDDQVQFCCADIPQNAIMVVLRVYDTAPAAGPVADTYLAGHYSDCMIQVEVQDKRPPVILCPPDLTISCQFPFSEENLDVFGSVALAEGDRQPICYTDPGVPGPPSVQCPGRDGLATDNCSVAVSSTAHLDISPCGTGTIVRTFTATDGSGLQTQCQQTITIVNYDPFTLADITWPADYTARDICSTEALQPEFLPAPNGYPVLQDGLCDLVAATYEDLVFDLTDPDQACFKILRTWTVIDWCQLNTPAGGRWERVQVIKVMNSHPPVIAPLADRTECSYADDCSGLTLSLGASATDDCSGPATLRWRYSIDENNDNIFEETSAIKQGGSVWFSRQLPPGTHRILFTVWDQCGNTSRLEQRVTVQNCKPPSAKCIHGLSTNLMGMDTDGNGIPDWGMVNVRAEMFDAGSEQTCGHPITFAFSADPNDKTRVFDCTQRGINDVEVWVIDQVTGLTDFCLTTLDVQDNDRVCPQGIGGAGTISGSITVPATGKLGGVSVRLEGSQVGDVTTSPEGYFIFPQMVFGGSYTVRPMHNRDARNGVSTIDLVNIQKHLLGQSAFTTPYQYIAADANNSGSVTAIDILQLRKLILGLADTLPSNTSWRFIDKAHVFADPHNPWLSPWAETYTISPFASSLNDVDFDAVKVGDLNASASLRASGKAVMPRGSERAKIEYTVSPDREDGVYQVQVFLRDADQYEAVQFSFSWDYYAYTLLNWAAGDALGPDAIRMPDKPGDPAAVAAFQVNGWPTEKLHLLTFWVRATGQPSPLSVFLNHQPTTPLAYTREGDQEQSVYIEGTRGILPEPQNRPNPFRDMTTITFDSGISGPATFTARDPGGRTVLTKKIVLVQGANEMVVRRAELGGPGIYQYDIETEHQFLTNRMIIVE